MELTSLKSWEALLAPQLKSLNFASLSSQVDQAYSTTTVYPPAEDLFAAFALTPPESVRVVILGQDPYHGPDQANGLAFSVRPGIPLPPSLRNIFQERQADLNLPFPANGDLSSWARQGVFLLNTVLTVEAGKANSHKNIGWQEFTDGVISALAKLPQPISFVLWGAQAQKKAPIIAASSYPRQILTAPHPSPLSAYRGFFGSRPFSQINAFLQKHGTSAIVW